VNETETSITPQGEQDAYERCDQCSSPVDKAQRYCVVCGARNKRAEDPVAGYLAVATSRSRAAKTASPASGRRRRMPGLGTAAVIAAIPLAVALGVIVGRANSGGDAKLIAALRAQKAPVVNVTGGGSAASSDATSADTPAVSTFSLSKGYAVELTTLPVQGTSQAAVTQAENAAQAKGATAVGVLDENGFSISPKPSGDVYVVYSGQYDTKAEAAAALAKLKRRFPTAVVIAVQATAKSSSSSSSSAASATSSKPVSVPTSKKALAQGSSEANQISHATGKGYDKAQDSLPGEVSVP
jgi:hypothetical protein